MNKPIVLSIIVVNLINQTMHSMQGLAKTNRLQRNIKVDEKQKQQDIKHLYKRSASPLEIIRLPEIRALIAGTKKYYLMDKLIAKTGKDVWKKHVQPFIGLDDNIQPYLYERAKAHSISKPIKSIEFSPNGNKIMVVTNDSEAFIWDSEVWDYVDYTIKTGAPANVNYQARFYNDENAVIVESDDGVTTILNLSDQRRGFTFPSLQCASPIIAISRDLTKVTTRDPACTIHMFNLPVKKSFLVYGATTIQNNWKVTAAEYNNDGSKLLTINEVGTIIIYNSKTGAREGMIKTDDVVTTARFNHDSTKIIGIVQNEVKIWNINTGECERSIQHGKEILEGVAFNHDSTKVAIAYDNAGILGGNYHMISVLKLSNPNYKSIKLTAEQRKFLWLLEECKNIIEKGPNGQKRKIISFYLASLATARKMTLADARRILHSFEYTIEKALIKKYKIRDLFVDRQFKKPLRVVEEKQEEKKEPSFLQTTCGKLALASAMVAVGLWHWWSKTKRH